MRARFARAVLMLLCAFPACAQDDIADVPCVDRAIEGRASQRYFLIGAKDGATAPPGGYALLLVLPGGDGSAEFNPFVKRIWKNALPQGFLVAQLVAVSSNNKQQIVWPTTRTKDPKQDFPTEQFIRNVIDDVKKLHTVDDGRIYAMGWSSGGPAVYACALAKDSPLRGAFVAMSVFIKSALPPIENAKGRRFFLYQSPEDKLTRYVSATQAEEALRAAGAEVILRDYPGGHGWRGDVFGDIRAGIDWLEKP